MPCTFRSLAFQFWFSSGSLPVHLGPIDGHMTSKDPFRTYAWDLKIKLLFVGPTLPNITYSPPWDDYNQTYPQPCAGPSIITSPDEQGVIVGKV